MILSITDIGYLAIQVIIAFTPVNTLCKKGIAAKNVLDYIYFKKNGGFIGIYFVYLIVADVTKYTLNP